MHCVLSISADSLLPVWMMSSLWRPLVCLDVSLMLLIYRLRLCSHQHRTVSHKAVLPQDPYPGVERVTVSLRGFLCICQWVCVVGLWKWHESHTNWNNSSLHCINSLKCSCPSDNWLLHSCHPHICMQELLLKEWMAEKKYLTETVTKPLLYSLPE